MPLFKKNQSTLVLRPLKAERSESSAFNFFQSCQSSLHPEWGCHILKFEIPGGESTPENASSSDGESSADSKAA